MDIWESIEFGAHAVRLKLAASKSPQEIQRLGRSRLAQLVHYARAKSEYWREKLAGVSEGSFELTDLPTSSKPELMDNFDRAVTADDLRRDEIESFLQDESNLGVYFKG